MFDRVLARQRGIDARALARCTNCIHSVVVIIANLSNELGLEYTAIADRKARCLIVAIDNGHLEAVCAASLQGEVDRRVGNHLSSRLRGGSGADN